MMSASLIPVMPDAQAGVRERKCVSSSSGHIGVRGEVFAIGKAFREQHVHDGTGERTVRARANHQVHIGLLGRRRAVRIDHNQFCVAVAPRLADVVHHVDLRMHRVAAPHDDEVAGRHFSRIDAAAWRLCRRSTPRPPV